MASAGHYIQELVRNKNVWVNVNERPLTLAEAERMYHSYSEGPGGKYDTKYRMVEVIVKRQQLSGNLYQSL